MVRGLCIAAILVLYVAACLLPAVGHPNDPNSSSLPGYICLVYPLAFIIPVWWANPLLFLGCVTLGFGLPRTSLGLGAVAAALGIAYFGFSLYSKDDDFMVGAYLWLASLIGLPLASYYVWKLAPASPAVATSTPS